MVRPRQSPLAPVARAINLRQQGDSKRANGWGIASYVPRRGEQVDCSIASPLGRVPGVCANGMKYPRKLVHLPMFMWPWVLVITV